MSRELEIETAMIYGRMNRSRAWAFVCTVGVFLSAPPRPAAAGETASQLVDRLEKKIEGLQTIHQVARLTMEEDKQSRRTTVKTWKKKAGKVWKSRVVAGDGKEDAQSKGEEGRAGETVTVFDGEFEWREVEAGDKVLAVKSRPAEDSRPSLAEVRSKLKDADVKIKGSEKVGGLPCAVIEINGTDRGERFEATYWISEDHGLILRSHFKRADRNRVDMVTVEIKINETIPDSQFAYTPPAGATILDTESMAKPERGK